MGNDVRLFGFGHSHILAILRGAKSIPANANIAVEGINLRDDVYRNLLSRPLDDPTLREILSRASNADVIFLCIQGNQHNALALVEPPVPFDFYHTGLPHLPIRDDAVVVPYRTLRQILEHELVRARDHFARLKVLLDKPMVQCQPPPPIPSESHIRKYSSVFEEEIKRSRLGALSVRMKMWKVQCEVMQALCDEFDIQFLPCPIAALDASGFLAASAWASNPTHANANYGALVVRQLAKVARSRNRA